MLFTLPGPHDHETLFAHAKGSIPSPMRTDRDFEELHAGAAMGELVLGTVRENLRQGLISTSEGIWLNQHASDQDLARQGGETDPALRIRIRQPQVGVTRVAILQLADDILAADNVVGSSTMIEFPCEAAFVGDVADSIATANVGFAFTYDLADYPDGFGYPIGIGASAPVVTAGAILLGVSCGGAAFTVFVPSSTPDGTLASIQDMVRDTRMHGSLAVVQREV